jgi:long-chain acyl-CoA synthetase
MGCSGSREFSVYNNHGESEGNLKSQSGPYVNVKNGDLTKITKDLQNITLIGQLEESFNKNANNKCVGWREAKMNEEKKELEMSDTFRTFSYKEMWNMATTLARQITKLNLAPDTTYEKDDNFDGEDGTYKMLGLFARNCPDWLCMDLACQLNSVTTATFYSTLGDESFEHVFNQTRLQTICITPENITVLIKYHEKYRFKSMKNVILLDLCLYVNPKDVETLEMKMKEFGVNTYYLSKLVATKPEDLKDYNYNVSLPDTLLTLCYTSGTTNLPKGVKLTQRNVGSQCVTLADVDLPMSESDVHYSYLPLAHIMERSVIVYLMTWGASIYFISGEPKKYLVPELSMVGPTFMFAVPRVLTLIKTTIMDNFMKLTGFKKMLAERALATKEEAFDRTGEITHWLYDKIVFNKVRERFGGRLRVFIVGSAPLSVDLAKSIKVLFSVPIIEAYGMTETSGGVVGSSFLDTRNLDCGGAIRTNTFKLIDVPEMGYHSLTTDSAGQHAPTGEICVKGLNITKGYFRDRKNTESTIDKDGWLHTGDVGRVVHEDQGLKIIDRVKEIFKLAQGEYIAPSKLEGAYGLNPYIEQICIHGDSLHTFIVAIIFPSRLKVKMFLVEKGLLKEEDPLESVDAFYEKEVVQDEIRASFAKIAKEKNFNSLERISKMILATDMFSLQNGLLTDTMKMKRKSFQTTFSKQIDACYGN